MLITLTGGNIMELDMKSFKRDLLLGALGALLMTAGDLSLSLIAPSNADSGLYAREAYMNGSYGLWRPVFLLITGIPGMFFYYFGVRAMHDMIKPECKKLRFLIKYGGLGYICSGAALHFFVGSLSYWVTSLTPEFGRETALRIVGSYYDRFIGGEYLLYIPIAALMLGSFAAVISGRTALPKKMAVFHALTWQIILVSIPHIRMLFSPDIITADYAFSQSSGNAAALIMFIACFIWAVKSEERGG